MDPGSVDRFLVAPALAGASCTPVGTSKDGSRTREHRDGVELEANLWTATLPNQSADLQTSVEFTSFTLGSALAELGSFLTSDNPDFGSFGQTTKAHTGVGIAQPKTASRKHAPTPSIEMSPNAKAYVTSVIKPVMAPLEAIVLAKASEVRLRVRGLRWTVFKFKDEKRTDVVLRVSVAAKREQALAFWEYLGSRIDEWLGRLPEQTADVVQDRVSVEIVWQ